MNEVSGCDSKFSIAICLPYFGKFPNYFDAFLKSCGANSTIDFLLFTDNCENIEYPSNFKIYHTTLQEIKNRLDKIMGFSVCLDTPYKICDYRPAFGALFEEELSGYDFWGHCDTDLVFGNIRNFFTDEILENYDKIGHLGHLAFYRNSPVNNARYSLKVDESGDWEFPYRYIFSQSNLMAFDEWPWTSKVKYSINSIFLKNNFPTYYKNHYADLVPFIHGFSENYYDPFSKQRSFAKVLAYLWENGTLRFIDNNGNLGEERLYVHFLKRKMQLKFYDKNCKTMLIVPNKILCDKSKISLLNRFTIKTANIINIEKRQRSFKIFEGKVISFLRKKGLWK